MGLAVNDTGVCIADDVLPRIFEPFFTTKEMAKRSALGWQIGYRYDAAAIVVPGSQTRR